MQRVRVKFSKSGPMRFTSNLDLARAWERLLRRANLPVAYSKGYNPRPRLQLAAALPLGFTSECEIIDIRMETQLPLEELLGRLRTSAPPGIAVHTAKNVELKEKSLQVQLESTEYRAKFKPPDDITERVEILLATESLPREWRGKAYDLRPLVILLWFDGDARTLHMQLKATPGNTGRPDEVLMALGLDPLAAHIHRTRLIFKAPVSDLD